MCIRDRCTAPCRNAAGRKRPAASALLCFENGLKNDVTASPHCAPARTRRKDVYKRQPQHKLKYYSTFARAWKGTRRQFGCSFDFFWQSTEKGAAHAAPFSKGALRKSPACPGKPLYVGIGASSQIFPCIQRILRQTGDSSVFITCLLYTSRCV